MKAARIMSEATLKARVLTEIKGKSWDVPEIGRQLGCGERMVFHHFRYGLPSRIVNGKRVTTRPRPRRIAPASVEDRMNRPPK